MDTPRLLDYGKIDNLTAMEVLLILGSCTSIQADAFADSRQLREVWLPKDCQVDPSAFDACPALSAIYAPAGGQSEAFILSFAAPDLRNHYLACFRFLLQKQTER